MKEKERSALRVLDVARHDLRVRKVLENVKGGGSYTTADIPT